MIAPLPTLEERLTAIEAQLNGDYGADPIDLRALPLKRLYNDLEFNWRPDARQLLQAKSMTHQEIGVLPGTRIYFGGGGLLNVAIVNNYTMIPYDTVQYDFPGAPAIAGDPVNQRILIQVPGTYVISAGVQIDATGAAFNTRLYLGYTRVGLNVLTGEVQIGLIEHVVSAGVGTNPAFNLATLYDCNSGDSIRAQVYQASAGNRTILGGTHVHLAAHWLGTGRTA